MRHRITAVAGLFLLFAARAAGQEQAAPAPLTLEESVSTALKNNFDVKQSELRSESASILLKQARRDLLPAISGSVGHGYNQGRSIDPFTNSYIDQNVGFANYSLGGSITLFNGLLLQNSIKQNSLAWEASKMEHQQAREKLTLDVILAYLQILSNEDLLNQARLRAELSKAQVQRLETLNKEGAIPPSQLYDLQGQLANDELSIINTRNALNASKLQLAQLMNVEYQPDLQVARLNEAALQLAQRYPFSASEIYSSAVDQLAVIRGAALRKESAAKGVQVARSGGMPNLSFNSNLFSNYSSLATRNSVDGIREVTTDQYIDVNGTRYPVIAPERNIRSEKIDFNDQLKNNYSSSFSLNLRIPIFNSLQTRSRVAQARVDLRNAELVEATTQLELKQAVDQAYFNMQAAWDRYGALNRQVEAFKQAFRAAEVRFNAGAGTSVDYSVAKNNYDQAQINLINARYDYVLRSKVLDYYRGALTLE
ncbi:MAG TPA: TolC family protein [Sphingobacteriaceae bacterium]